MNANGASNGSRPREPHVLEIVGNAIVGGMEVHVERLVAYLLAQRFRVTCLAPFESPVTASMRELGCAVFVARVLDDPAWRSIQTGAEIVRQRHVDLIHAHMPKAHGLGGLIGAVTHTPVVATMHGMNLTTQELGIQRTVGSDLIAVCQETYWQAMAMGVPPERVTMIHNGVDTHVYSSGGDATAFRESLGVPAGAPLVGFVGRLAPEKGPDLFVRAAGIVHLNRPDAHFVMVGDGDMRPLVEDLIGQLGLGEHVHLAGVRAHTQEVFPAIDVVAQTSRSEGMPLTLLEAMACARPVVAIGVGGVPEVIEVGRTGLLAGVGDWEAVALGVINLLEHPDRLAAYGAAARLRVQEHFDLQHTLPATAALFRRLARSRVRAPEYGV